MGTFTAVLLLGSMLVALFGGAGTFVWMITHGSAGPLGVALLHGGTLSTPNATTALILLGSAALVGFSKSRWVVALSIFAVVLWVVMGWGAGV